jgi:hypothetical protein
LIVSRQGQGTFVVEGIEAAPELEEIATEALRRARDAGLGPRDLAIVTMACASIPGSLGDDLPADLLSALPDPEEESEAIEVRQELRRQIGRLEAELASYTRDLSADLPTAPRRAVAHVAGVQELEQTRDTLIAQLSEAQRAAEQRAREEAQIRARRQRAREGGEAKHGGAPGGGPLGRAMRWWRAEP